MTDHIELATFQAGVFNEINFLSRVLLPGMGSRGENRHKQPEQLLKELLELAPDEQEWQLVRQKITKEERVRLEKHLAQISIQKAQVFLARRDIRDYLCPALQTAVDDAFEIAKIITPILFGLVIAGTLSIPLVPIFFASISLLVSRMGIASLCLEYDKENKNEQ
jgi:hypothetical protein